MCSVQPFRLPFVKRTGEVLRRRGQRGRLHVDSRQRSSVALGKPVPHSPVFLADN